MLHDSLSQPGESCLRRRHIAGQLGQNWAHGEAFTGIRHQNPECVLAVAVKTLLTTIYYYQRRLRHSVMTLWPTFCTYIVYLSCLELVVSRFSSYNLDTFS